MVIDHLYMSDTKQITGNIAMNKSRCSLLCFYNLFGRMKETEMTGLSSYSAVLYDDECTDSYGALTLGEESNLDLDVYRKSLRHKPL